MSIKTRRGSINLLLDVVATLAAVTGCVFLAWLNWDKFFPPNPKAPEMPVSMAGATLRGDDGAPVVLIEYSDYMCPYCARFETDVLPVLALQYIDTARVQLVFKHHPLERLHRGATKAAEAALCAGRQGKFWNMHEALFRQPKGLDDSRLIALAREIGVGDHDFERCLAGEVSAQVMADVAEAETLGLSGTPAFLIGRRLADGTVRAIAVVDGARPVADFERAIKQALRPPWLTSAILTGGGVITILAVGLGARWLRVRRRDAKGREVS